MAYRKLGRTSSQRKAMLRDLATDLIVHERIQTTEARAKELRSVVEKMITLGKRGDLHARRQVAQYIRRELVVTTNAEGEDEEALQFKNYLIMLLRAIRASRRIYTYHEKGSSSR